MDFKVRLAVVEDCKDILRMISELAEHEKNRDPLILTQKDLEQDGFSDKKFFHVVIAEVPEQHKSKDGDKKIGYSMFFYGYSWKGRTVLMEDLYVMPEFRGKGIGKALMSKVAQLGWAAGCRELTFTVLNWNKRALDFYKNQGSVDTTPDQGYRCMCVCGDAFQKMADRDR